MTGLPALIPAVGRASRGHPGLTRCVSRSAAPPSGVAATIGGHCTSAGAAARPRPTAAAAMATAPAGGAGGSGGGPAFKAVLLDVGNTLMSPSEPVAETYLRLGRPYGVTVSAQDVKIGFKKAFAAWPADQLRYEGDGRPFWRHVVSAATGCSDQAFFEQLYLHYLDPAAWTVAPGAEAAVGAMRAAGVRVGLCSNWDDRLRPTLHRMGWIERVDAAVISCEVRAEKPAGEIFAATLAALGPGLLPADAVVIGDEPINDCEGAARAGMTGWLWGVDVTSMDEVADRVLRRR